MSLQTLWFILIAVLWSGYFVLEGFDFGVGMLLPFLPREEAERGMMLDAIGPIWDGNEVWLIVAGGATFAAFPLWYASVFSGFYLALMLILVCLIVRVVSFEWREKGDSPRWRRFWAWANAVGSAGAALIWGIALANFLHGVPLNQAGEYSGGLLELFSPFTVFAGLTTVLLFLFHGAGFLNLRVEGALRARAERLSRRLAVPALIAGVALMGWTVAVAVDVNERGAAGPAIVALLGSLALLGAVLAAFVKLPSLCFGLGAAGIVGVVATLFTGLYPRVLVSSSDFANSLTTTNAASSHYALTVITVVALITLPVVLAYQSWSYWVFRHRVSARGFEGVGSPVEALRRRAEGRDRPEGTEP